jgi:hypothetical protein
MGNILGAGYDDIIQWWYISTYTCDFFVAFHVKTK